MLMVLTIDLLNIVMIVLKQVLIFHHLEKMALRTAKQSLIQKMMLLMSIGEVIGVCLRMWNGQNYVSTVRGNGQSKMVLKVTK